MQSHFTSGMFSFVMAGAVFLGSPAQADQAAADASQPAADMCGAVALAKFKQWTQPKLMIEQTNTFADGSKRGMELIVTENTAYAHFGSIWKTAMVTRPERGVATPEVLARKMGLATCAKADQVQESGEQATVYSFSYKPDDDGTVSKGSLWVSDATGLPLRQEFDRNGPTANSRVAMSIEKTYRYNTDVTVPRGAELAESSRLFRNRLPLFSGQSGLGGDAQ